LLAIENKELLPSCIFKDQGKQAWGNVLGALPFRKKCSKPGLTVVCFWREAVRGGGSGVGSEEAREGLDTRTSVYVTKILEIMASDVVRGVSSISSLKFQNEELRNLSLSGHVGFDSLPDQLVNKSTSQGFCFNILCVGK
jgi:hypothetical protein